MAISNSTDRFNGVIASLAVKVRCVVGSTVNVVTLDGEQTVDGVSVVENDRVLLTAQTDPIENGAYDVQIGPWTRAADWDGSRDVELGSTIWAGRSAGSDTLFQVTAPAGVIQPGNTSVTITLLLDPDAPSASNLQAVTDQGFVTTNQIHLNGASLLITETASAPIAFAATIGQLWVRNDAPNVLMFSDDLGGAYQLSSVAGVLPVGTFDNSPLVWVDPAWVENVAIRLGAGGLFLGERNVDEGDLATYGQFWVRDDAPMTPMFTADDGTEFELNKAGSGIDTFNYSFSTSTSMTDPGAGFVRLNNAAPASATTMSISITDADGTDLDPDLGRVQRSTVITFRDPADPTRFARYSVSGAQTDGGTHWLFPIAHIEGTTAPLDNAEISVQLRDTPDFDAGFILTGTILTYNDTVDRYEANDGDWRLTNDGATSQLHSNDNLAFSSSFDIRFTKEFFMLEQAAADTSVATYGQVWVRDDVPNTLMFTDDVGNDFVLSGGPGGLDVFNYNYSDTITSGGIAAGEVRYNSLTPSAASLMFLSETDANGNDITAVLDRMIDAWVLRLKDPEDLTIDVVHTQTLEADSGTFRTITLSHQRGATFPADGTPVVLELSDQPWVELGIPSNGEVYSHNDVTEHLELSSFFARDAGGSVTDIGTTVNSVLDLSSTSQVRTSQLFAAAFTDNNNALILFSNGGDLTIQTNVNGGPLFMQGGNGNHPVVMLSTMALTERSNALGDVATRGQIWLRNDVLQTLMFTDEAGTDFVIGGDAFIGLPTGTVDGAGFVWDTGNTAWEERTNLTFLEQIDITGSGQVGNELRVIDADAAGFSAITLEGLTTDGHLLFDQANDRLSIFAQNLQMSAGSAVECLSTLRVGAVGDSLTIETIGGTAMRLTTNTGSGRDVAILADNGARDLHLTFGTGLLITEKAAQHSQNAGEGQIWVRDDVPNVLVFTDDTGVDFVISGAGGGVTASGSPLNNEIAVFTGATDIDSNANFTYDATQVDLTGTVSRALTVRGPSFQLAVHDSVSAGDSADSFEMNVQDDLMFLQGTDDSGAVTRSLINMDVTTGLVRLGNTAAEIIVNNDMRLEDNDELRFGDLAGGDASIDWDSAAVAMVFNNEAGVGSFQFRNAPVHVRDGEAFAIFDSTNNDNVNFILDAGSSRLIVEQTGVAAMRFDDLNLEMDVNQSVGFGNSQEYTILFDGTDLVIDGEADLQITGGVRLQVFQTSSSNFVALSCVVGTARIGATATDLRFQLNGVDEGGVQDGSATGNTSGLFVRDNAAVDHDVGFNDLRVFNDNVSDTLEANHAGQVAFKDATTARTLTLASNVDLDFPVGAMTTVINAFATGDYTITEGASTTLFYLDGTDAVDTTGGAIVGPGGVANIWRESATVYYIWGTGITP